jgi:hypothetical protein
MRMGKLFPECGVNVLMVPCRQMSSKSLLLSMTVYALSCVLSRGACLLVMDFVNHAFKAVEHISGRGTKRIRLFGDST